MKPKILGVTLARSGSQSVKNKNIIMINNKPLIAHTIKEALKSKYITDYIISTNCKKIKKISKKFGAIVPFLRPKKFSTNTASSASALKHALLKSEKIFKKKYDYVVELMSTNPLKNIHDIDSILKIIIKKKADSVIAVHQLFDHHPSRIKKIIKGKLYDFKIKEKLESRRQDLTPRAFIRSGSIYAMSRSFVLQEKRYVSGKSYAYILPYERSVNIDDKYDLIVAKAKMNER